MLVFFLLFIYENVGKEFFVSSKKLVEGVGGAAGLLWSKFIIFL